MQEIFVVLLQLHQVACNTQVWKFACIYCRAEKSKKSYGVFSSEIKNNFYRLQKSQNNFEVLFLKKKIIKKPKNNNLYARGKDNHSLEGKAEGLDF